MPMMRRKTKRKRFSAAIPTTTAGRAGITERGP